MAIFNIKLTPYTPSGSRLIKAGDFRNVKLTPGITSTELFLVWETYTGTNWCKTFDIACDVRGLPRGLVGTGDNAFGNLISFWKNVPAESCHATKIAGGYRWYYRLDPDSTSDGITKTFKEYFGAWPFASRTYDALQIHMRMKANYQDGKYDARGLTYSEVTSSDLTVEWVPNYVLGTCSYTLEHINIAYTADNWERYDDRYQVEQLKDASGNNLLARSNVWGTVDGLGNIELPLSYLSRVPTTDKIYARVRMNASYKASGSTFAYIDGNTDVENKSVCSTPALTLSWSGSKLVVKVGDAKDVDTSYTTALVKIRGGQYSFDQATVTNGGTITFDYPPLGADVTVEATGFGDESRSATTAKTIKATTLGYDLIEEIDGDAIITGRLNQSHSISAKRNVTTQTIEGRTRPVAWYGKGGEVSWSLDYALITKNGVSTTYAQDPGAYDALMDAGVCVLRTCKGWRRVVAVESYRLAADTPFATCSASLSLSEVDYD